MKTSMLHLGLLVGALFSVNTASAQSVVTTTGGTANYVPKFTGSATVGKSQIVDTGTNVGVGTSAPKTTLHLYNTTTHAELRAETTFADQNHVPAISVKNPSTEWSFGLTDGTGLNIRENSASYASRMFIKNGGNVGIGTSSPLEKFETIGRIKTRLLSTGNSTGVALDPTVTNTPQVTFHASDNSDRAEIRAVLNNITSNDRLTMRLNTIDALNIVGNGNVGIGTTAPTEKLQVNGNVKANSFLIGAAARQTNQILPLDNALGRIQCLEGVSYRAKGAKAGDDAQLGMVGEDVEACFPELVVTDAQGEKSIDYARMVVPLVETAKEQQQTILELEARLARLEARLK